MKRTITYCDFCGNELPEKFNIGDHDRKYCITRYYVNLDCKCDICDDCYSELIKFISSRKENKS